MPPYIKNTLLNFFSFFLIALSLYIFISLISYDISDSGFFNKNSSDSIKNLGGPLGASIADFLFTLIGFGGYAILLIGCVWSIQTLFYEDPYSSITKTLVRIVSSLFFIICFCSIGDLYLGNNFGGVLGSTILKAISSIFGNIGSLIFLVIFLIPTTALSFNFSWIEKLEQFGKLLIVISNYSWNLLKTLGSKLKEILMSLLTKSKEIVIAMQRSSHKKKSAITKPKISNEPQIKEVSVKETPKDLKQGDLPIETKNPLKEVEKKEVIDEPDAKKEKAVMPSTELLDRALDDGSSLSEGELNEIASLL